MQVSPYSYSYRVSLFEVRATSSVLFSQMNMNIDFEPREVTDVKYGRILMQKGILSRCVAPVACAQTAHGLGSRHRWAGIFSAYKFNCDMKIVTHCYIRLYLSCGSLVG